MTPPTSCNDEDKTVDPAGRPMDSDPLDALATSVTPQRIRQVLRVLHRDPRWQAEGAIPFFVLVERLAGALGAAGSSLRWQAQGRVRDALHAVLPHTTGVIYSPPT